MEIAAFVLLQFLLHCTQLRVRFILLKLVLLCLVTRVSIIYNRLD